MVTITNGATVLTVTKGAYETMYAPQGWEKIRTDALRPKNDDFSIVDVKQEVMPVEAENDSEDKNTSSNEGEFEDEEPEVELSEIPLSEMSVPQLKTYAKQLGVNVNTDSARQLRSQIKKALGG